MSILAALPRTVEAVYFTNWFVAVRVAGAAPAAQLGAAHTRERDRSLRVSPR
jgi:hypothetical protein